MTELLPIGIHFGLPDAAHHADPALGSTAIKDILSNAVDWQFDRLFGEDKPDTKALIWGSAFHARVLEGERMFHQKFRIAPDIADYAKEKTGLVLLKTVDDIKAELGFMGVSTKGCTRKEQFLRLLRDAGSKALVWDEIVDKFKAEVDEGRVSVVDQRTLKQIETAAEWLQAHSKTGPVMKRGTFMAGASEVTMVYEYRGVRLKARFDYLYPTLAIDLKSYRPWTRSGTPLAAIKAAIEKMGYDIQSAAYRRAFDAMRDLYEAGTLEIFGEPPTADFVDKMFKAAREVDDGMGNMVSTFRWLWVMVKASGAPTATILEFPKELDVFQAADRNVEDAIDIYIRYRDKFGINETWRPDENVIVLANEDFRPSWGLYR